MCHIGGIPNPQATKQFFSEKSFTPKVSQVSFLNIFFKIPKGAVRTLQAASKLLLGGPKFWVLFFRGQNITTCSIFWYFAPYKIERGQNFGPSNSNLDAAWSLPPLGILRKYCEMKSVKLLAWMIFGKKSFCRPGIPLIWNITEIAFLWKCS